MNYLFKRAYNNQKAIVAPGQQLTKSTPKCGSCNVRCYAKEKDMNYSVETLFPYFLVKLLKEIGVDAWTGLPGSNQLNHYFAVNQLNIPFNVCRNEANGGFIAVGASRYSAIAGNKRQLIGLFLDQGPGISQAVNPCVSATLDGIPLLCVSSYDINEQNHNRVIQDVDPSLVLGNISKGFYMITQDDINNGSIIQNLYNAIQAGFSYPRGTINIVYGYNTLRMDATSYLQNFDQYATMFRSMFVSEYGLKLTNEVQVSVPFTNLFTPQWIQDRANFITTNEDKIISTLNYNTFFSSILTSSSKPLMVIGVGAHDCVNDLIDFCKKIQVPYLCTLGMAEFANANDDYCAIRMGHTATWTGNNMANNADCIIAVGCTYNNYTFLNFTSPFQPNATIVGINPYPELVDTTQLINYYIVDKIENVLNNVDYTTLQPVQPRTAWFQYLKDLKVQEKQNNKILYAPKATSPLYPGNIYPIIQRQLDKFITNNPTSSVSFFTDSGTAQPFSASLFTFNNKRYHFLTSHKLASIGNGLGNAIGMAKFYPNDIIVLIAGDTSSLFSCSDIISIQEFGIKNLIIIIYENYGMGLIDEESHIGFNKMLEFANGYKYYPSWESTLRGMLLKTNVAKTSGEFSYHFANGMNNILKESFCVVAMLPNYSPFSPVIKMGDKLTNMVYEKIGEEDVKIDKCRFKHLN